MVNPQRANLIKWFSFSFEGSSRQAAIYLARIAIEKNYISNKKAPPGEILKHWIVNNNAPQWACRAAFDYLMQNGWKPNDDIQCAIAARYLLLNEHKITKEWSEVTGQWLILAYQAQQESK